MTKAKMPAFWVAALYAAAVAAIYFSAMGVVTTGGRLPLLLLVPLLALLLPPLRNKLDPRARYLPGPPWTLGTALVLVFFQASLFGSHAEESAAKKEAQLQQEAAARIATAKADRAAEYAREKPQILAQVEALLAANQPKEALAAANKFFAANPDPDLARLRSRAELGVMKLELQVEAALPLERREQIYKTLMKEEPGAVALYSARLKDVTEALELRRKVAAQAEARTAREASIKGQFSGWDGSHRQVERELKARMKNPKSYEHVDTRYSVGPDSVTVVATYRGTNSFGAVVTNRAVATVDIDGNVLSLEDR